MDWADRGMRHLHWHATDHNSWLALGLDEQWHGWRGDGSTTSLGFDAAWRPWHATNDGSGAPFIRWFAGGITNAAFNEVDRHLLLQPQDGARSALISESLNRPPTRMSSGSILLRSVLIAHALREGMGISFGARIAVYLPNRPEVRELLLQSCLPTLFHA
jgi:acrylyl-CoA reductase (NADPH)/3-hydroxypropionyl-CoA dehydratase/3-hydroxypropionyl-CoA synthetase